jgi:DNA-binding MarR family transcriptional regulator
MGHDFDRDLLILLHDVARLVRVEADKRARVRGMTRAQWAFLLRLSRCPGMTQKEVADMLDVEPISVARLVDRMAAAGLVERRADAADRRVWRLFLLPSATGMLGELQRERERLTADMAAGLPPEVRETMIKGLQKMKSNLTNEPHIHPLPLQTITVLHPESA